MKNKFNHKIILCLILVVLVLSACSSSGEEPPSAPPEPLATLLPEETLFLGDVSGDAAWTIEHFQPLADYLAENLADFGIKGGRVVVTSDLSSMMDKLEAGEVNLYFDSPFPALEVYENIGAQPIARRWKSGVSEYHSLIVVRTDSGITDLDGLLGKVLAFDHPASTSGYLLPKAHLVINGYETAEVDDTSGEVAADAIGYTFAYGEENQALWLLEGKVAGAGMSNGDFEYIPEEQRAQLTVLAQTPPVPRHVALAAPGMDPALQERITELLLEIHQTPEGQQVLETFEETSRFDELPGGPENFMSTLQELFAPGR
jgi:phosphonate transport system substrate-binding protein